MAAMRFEQVQRFILAKKIWGVRGTLNYHKLLLTSPEGLHNSKGYWMGLCI